MRILLMTFIQYISFGQSCAAINTSELNCCILFLAKANYLVRYTLSRNTENLLIFSAFAILPSSEVFILDISFFQSRHDSFVGGVFSKQGRFLTNTPTPSNSLPQKFSNASEQRTFKRHTLEREHALFSKK